MRKRIWVFVLAVLLAMACGVGQPPLTDTPVIPSDTPAPPPPPAPSDTPEPDFSLAVGKWQSIDIDGSNQTLDITLEADGSYSFALFDDGASACGLDASGNPLYAFNGNGNGTATGLTLTASGASGICDTTGEVINFDSTFTYDPASDTLTDGIGVSWTRR